VSTRPSTRALQSAGYYSFVLLGWQTVILPSLIRSIEHGFHQSDAAFGVLYLVKSILYAVGAFAGGFLTERLGRRIVLSAAAVISALSLLLAALAPSWAPFVLGAALVSLGGAVIDAGVNGLFLDLFREARGGALNFLHLFFSVGALIAPLPIGVLISAGVAWQAVMAAAAAASFIMATVLAALPMPSGRHHRDVETDSGGAIGESERRMLPFFALAGAIGLYVAQELGVSNWVVRFLSDQPLSVATATLSVFWLGLSVGRLASRWVAEMFDYTAFTVACVILASITLALAVVVPWFPLSLAFFGLSGLFNGPTYPMIMAIGGQLYPHRLARLSGGLTAGGSLGTLVYPPLMGLMAAQVGLRVGMLGAAALGIPAAACLILARLSARAPQAPMMDADAA
jgi:FHS family glucose/mannose:H+ symporter-like MFS transporter